jgi:TonB family protein
MKKLLAAMLLLVTLLQTPQTTAQTKPDSIYQKVDIKPQYTGSEKALENFITTQTKYPQEALNQKQEGIIEVEFVVSKNGNITDVTCATGKHPELCNEAKRVIAKMPQWIPAKVKDVAVAAKQKIAIGFKSYNKQITYVIIPDELTASNEVLYHQDIMEEKGDPNGVDSELLSKPKSQSDDDALTFVEQMPEFNGDLYEYLNQSINYPVEAKENKMEGKVIAQFIVEKDGSISNAFVLRKMGLGMDEETLRVINNMPNWKPGKQNGKTVRVRYTLPVSFKLK